MKTWWKAASSAALAVLMVPAVFAQTPQNATTSLVTTEAGSGAAASAPAKDKKTESMSDVHIKPGTDYPHWQAHVGYAYDFYRPGYHRRYAGLNGGDAQIQYNMNHWFGFAFDFSGAHGKRCANGPNCPPLQTSFNDNLFEYGIGPVVTFRNHSRVTPFIHTFFAGVHGTDMYSFATNNSSFVATDAVTKLSSNTFGILPGGGIDIQLKRNIAWRLVQADYFLTRFDSNGGSRPQSNFRLSTGLVFEWGRHPEIMNRPPVVSLTPDKTSVMEGSGETINVHATASDPDNDPLTYQWSATCGQINGNGADAKWTPPATPGPCTVKVNVSDGHGGTADASTDLRVEPKPQPKPPTMSCSVDRGTVMAGERVTVTANANSPDNFTLTYTWRANAGQVTGTGATVTFDTSGLAPGRYTITGRIDDGHGQAADCQTAVEVQAPPPPAQASKINECAFSPINSARVDNVCKRVLDDVALRMQNEPKGTIVIIGYADPKERKADKVAGDRAENSKKYLTDKGIDASRITTRPGTGKAGASATENRHIEIIWVPEGATY